MLIDPAKEIGFSNQSTSIKTNLHNTNYQEKISEGIRCLR
ncbi:hypothetical protein LEP1GSC172_1430 [Leptospira noguchii]|uniref:Uncharacterized protein n=2 Tax=Leptospira noguchii TaxID=28182 RepID=T0FLL9_9LEPT|nr:hypothetical protein LEP1GSC172_1430 [Leptospira noguchii]EQA70450.1 hypothetical protein LEP1GSC059_0539 [Leptospira noguchii serovar Panama str. CZ214]